MEMEREKKVDMNHIQKVELTELGKSIEVENDGEDQLILIPTFLPNGECSFIQSTHVYWSHTTNISQALYLLPYARMLYHSREHYSHCYTWTTVGMEFPGFLQCVVSDYLSAKHSPYHYGIHNPVWSGNINKDGGNIRMYTVGFGSINVVPCFPFCLEQ